MKAACRGYGGEKQTALLAHEHSTAWQVFRLCRQSPKKRLNSTLTMKFKKAARTFEEVWRTALTPCSWENGDSKQSVVIGCEVRKMLTTYL
jgi:hypothetical protein